MKNNKIIILLLASVLMVGCAGDFLDVNTSGSTVTQEQFENNKLSPEAHVLGLYRKLMMLQGDDHDAYGEKSIGIHTDLISGDMALLRVTYGWYGSSDNLSQFSVGSALTAYLWSYYYSLIKNCNLIINTKGDMDLENPTPENKKKAHAIGQAYAMRGYCYYMLSVFYPSWLKDGVPCVPVYVEDSSDTKAEELSSTEGVLMRAENDLAKAVRILKDYDRVDSKTELDATASKLLLSYAFLYHASMSDLIPNPRVNDMLDSVKLLCDEVIATNKYSLLSKDMVTTTGFNTIKNNRNWIWGLEITRDISPGLPTFFGHMDIFTYSYAAAGDAKSIDSLLFAEIPSTDRRKGWFNTNSSGDFASFPLAPTGKFYTANRKGIMDDRTWNNDYCYLRIEEAYLLAAEASARRDNLDPAKQYLKKIVEQRDDVAAGNIDALDKDGLMKQIRFNWRVEMWGEGRGYVTMKRFHKENPTVRRGNNHYYEKGKEYPWDNERLCFRIPIREIDTNPNISE